MEIALAISTTPIQSQRVTLYSISGLLFLNMIASHVTPAEKGEHNFVSQWLEKNFEKFSFVNGSSSEAVDLIPVPLSHKVYVGFDPRSIIDSWASIYFSNVAKVVHFGAQIGLFIDFGGFSLIFVDFQ